MYCSNQVPAPGLHISPNLFYQHTLHLRANIMAFIACLFNHLHGTPRSLGSLMRATPVQTGSGRKLGTGERPVMRNTSQPLLRIEPTPKYVSTAPLSISHPEFAQKAKRLNPIDFSNFTTLRLKTDPNRLGDALPDVRQRRLFPGSIRQKNSLIQNTLVSSFCGQDSLRPHLPSTASLDSLASQTVGKEPPPDQNHHETHNIENIDSPNIAGNKESQESLSATSVLRGSSASSLRHTSSHHDDDDVEPKEEKESEISLCSPPPAPPPSRRGSLLPELLSKLQALEMTGNDTESQEAIADNEPKEVEPIHINVFPPEADRTPPPDSKETTPLQQQFSNKITEIEKELNERQDQAQAMRSQLFLKLKANNFTLDKIDEEPALTTNTVPDTDMAGTVSDMVSSAATVSTVVPTYEPETRPPSKSSHISRPTTNNGGTARPNVTTRGAINTTGRANSDVSSAKPPQQPSANGGKHLSLTKAELKRQRQEHIRSTIEERDLARKRALEERRKQQPPTGTQAVTTDHSRAGGGGRL